MGSFAVLGLAAPALLYAIIMVMLGWRNPAIGAQAGALLADPREKVIYLYESPATARHFSRVGGNYEYLLAPWRQYLNERTRPHRVIKSPKEITSIKPGVLVLASAVALGSAERDAIAAFRARGGSVLTTWATGSRNDNGDWVGWRFLEQLGVQDVLELPQASETRHLILNGESPVSHSHGAGQRIWMARSAEPLLLFKGAHLAGRLMKWTRVADEQLGDTGAVLFAEDRRTASRSVMLGFPESAWEARPVPTHVLIDDALDWLTHNARAVKAAWPSGKRAAQVIQMDTEEGFANARNFADLMRASAYPSTFFLLTSLAKQNPDVVAALASEFEIGFHGEVHTGFKGQDAATQKQRFAQMRSELASVFPTTRVVTGFRAPTEGYDATTESLMQQFGIRYHAADPGRSEARLPLFARIPGVAPADDLLVLPRTQRDDINLALEFFDTQAMSRALIEDFNQSVQTGALGWLSVHSQHFGEGSRLANAFPAYLAHTRQFADKVWFANARQVNDWWRDRERLRVASTFDGKRMDLNVTVTGNSPLTGASLVLMLPSQGAVPRVEAVKVGTATPVIQRIDTFRAAVVFNQLKPGNYNYLVTFDSH